MSTYTKMVARAVTGKQDEELSQAAMSATATIETGGATMMICGGICQKK